MPTLHTRVNLTLTPDVIAVLDRIGAVTGSGRATTLREFIFEAMPGFIEIAKSLELAREKNLDAFKVLAAALDSSVAGAAQLSLDIKRTRRRAMRKRTRD